MTEAEIERSRWQVFVLRVFTGDAGSLSGQVQHARTGEKRLFHGLEELARAITALDHSGEVVHDADGVSEEM